MIEIIKLVKIMSKMWNVGVYVVCMSKPKAISSGFLASLPAEAGNQRLGPDRRDNKERLCRRFGFYVRVGHQVVPVSMIQRVNLVGLDYFSGHQAWLPGAKTIHAICKAAVCIVGTYVFMATMGGGTAGAMPRD